MSVCQICASVKLGVTENAVIQIGFGRGQAMQVVDVKRALLPQVPLKIWWWRHRVGSIPTLGTHKSRGYSDVALLIFRPVFSLCQICTTVLHGARHGRKSKWKPGPWASRSTAGSIRGEKLVGAIRKLSLVPLFHLLPTQLSPAASPVRRLMIPSASDQPGKVRGTLWKDQSVMKITAEIIHATTIGTTIT